MSGLVIDDGPRFGIAADCEPILRALPEWFGIEDAIVQYVRDIETMPTFTAHLDGTVIGFVTLHRHFEHAAEMHVLGVLPEHHGRGIGRALVERCEAWLADEGVEYLQVKTVGPSRADCTAYAKTRAFYAAVGYRPLEEIPTLWDERNPCLIMIKHLADASGLASRPSP